MEDRKLIVADQRARFLADLQTAGIMLGNGEFEIVKVVSNLDDIHNDIAREGATELAVSENILQACRQEGIDESFFDFDIPVGVFTFSGKGIDYVKEFGLLFYGEAKNARNLYQLLEEPPYSLEEEYGEKVCEADIKNKADYNLYEEEDHEHFQNGDSERIVSKQDVLSQRQGNLSESRDVSVSKRRTAKIQQRPERQNASGLPGRQIRRRDIKEARLTRPQRKELDSVFDEYDESIKLEEEIGGDDGFESQRSSQKAARRNIRHPRQNPAQSLRETSEKRETDDKHQSVLQAEKRKKNPAKKKAKVYTFYAGKGGVGKTTMVTEVATYLSLTEKGRGTNEVCVVDYNIDFSDVGTVLSLENDSRMVYWADDIKERIDRGEDPETMRYSREDIRSFLVQMPDISLYCLLGPESNLDSYDINEKELKVMLRNIVENGGFDFVLCDSGNNTRDCSTIALQMADDVFLITTQEVTTAKCNVSALDALEEIGFDTSKVKILINKTTSKKIAGISAEEIEDFFKDYECAAHIRDNPDVTKANNKGNPLVFSANHSFTKEIGQLVEYILEDSISYAIPRANERKKKQRERNKKPGFLKRLFGRG